MDICAVGVPTYHTRVEAWECDHNQHWNVRQYMRCFHQARFVAASLSASPPPTGGRLTQQIRFHRELLLTVPVEVRSAVLADGALAGATVHILSSDGRLSATSVEQWGPPNEALPRVRAQQVEAALPRGFDGIPHEPAGPAAPEGAKVTEHGLVQPREADHTGSLDSEWLMARLAAASNDLLARLGFTREFVRAQGITRMGVETKLTRFGPIPVGTRTCGTVWVAEVGRKNVVLRHSIFRPGGEVLAAADQSLLAVDLKTRRATELPEFLRRATGSA